jgi:ribose transport system permease protein
MTDLTVQEQTGAADHPPGGGRKGLRGRLVRAWAERLAPLVALIVLVIVTALCEHWMRGTSNFLKLENWRNIFLQQSFIGIVALGMTFVIISGGIDLSVGSMVAMAGGIGIWLMNTAINAASIIEDVQSAKEIGFDVPYTALRFHLAQWFVNHHWAGHEMTGVWLAVGGTLAVGLLAGWLNGLLIAKGRMAPFIATLGGFAAYRSIAQAVADGGEFRSASSSLYAAVGSRGITVPWIHMTPTLPLTIPYPVIVFLGLAVVAAILLNRMRFGRYTYAIGSNERAAVYSAINVDRMKLLIYTLAGLTCGVAGLLAGSRMNSISSSGTGSYYELDAIAAVVIGGTRMTGGAGSIFGTVVGVLILGVISNMLNFLEVSPYLQGLVKGVIIVAAVLVQRVGRRER